MENVSDVRKAIEQHMETIHKIYDFKRVLIEDGHPPEQVEADYKPAIQDLTNKIEALGSTLPDSVYLAYDSPLFFN
jgi:hypothetical protein